MCIYSAIAYLFGVISITQILQYIKIPDIIYILVNAYIYKYIYINIYI